MSSISNQSSPVSHKKARRMVPIRYVLMPFAIIFLAIVVLALFTMSAPKPKKKTIENKAPLVSVEPLKRQSVQFSIHSQGTVIPRTETKLVSEVSGKITQVSDNFVVGGFFKKGEQILTIDDISYKVALLQAQARLDSAKAALEQEVALAKQAEKDWLLTGKPLSKAPVLALRKPQLNQAKASLKAAQADVQQAEVKLARTIIRAPYDAMVKAKNVDVGQFLTVGAQLATIFAVDYAEVRLPIKQQDIAFMNLPSINNQQHNIAVDLSLSLNGQTQHWQSYLTRYEGEINATTRVHYVVARIDDPYRLYGKSNQPELRIGNFVNAKIQGKTIDNIYAIPRKAVIGANTVHFVNDQYQLHIQDIHVLRSDHDFIYTQDSIDDKLQLLTTKLTTPVEQMTLRIAKQSEKQKALAEDVNSTAVSTGNE